MFSKSTTTPGFIAAMRDWVLGPVISVPSCTSQPSSSPNRVATGARLSSDWATPFGRPRCAITTTLAPAARSSPIVSKLARIRPSSVITRSPVSPVASGTFRSDRTRTTFPATSKSSRVRIPTRLKGGADERGEVNQAIAVAPLIVVPADNLGQVAIDICQT